MPTQTNIYSYVFVRKDLPDAVKIVQTGHACMEMAFAVEKPKEQVFLIALAVKDENDLLKTADILKGLDIKFNMFYEPDYNYGYTALCTEPVVFDKYPIFKKYEVLTIE